MCDDAHLCDEIVHAIAHLARQQVQVLISTIWPVCLHSADDAHQKPALVADAAEVCFAETRHCAVCHLVR